MSKTTCELCAQPGGEVLYRNEKFRVVLIDDAQYPGFCRVIWNEHVKEVTDLTVPDRALFMQAVWQVEAVVRAIMRPDKMNIASLGNIVPHLHWHVIPRFADDAHFPGPIWAQVQRKADESVLSARTALLPSLRESVIRQLNQID
ncbi:MAG: histidine triad (HIT) protein [Burkholderiales bacterium RIFCSPLOWO2_02_FULL_57_36]|nr:MAG: histidine triad (HIT) protein [Burkholderiales bacterium RIFCSPLOWO2_02_FULL_57_36]